MDVTSTRGDLYSYRPARPPADGAGVRTIMSDAHDTPLRRVRAATPGLAIDARRAYVRT